MDDLSTPTMSGRERGPSPSQVLPRPSGRRGIDRAIVVAEQRERIMMALAEAIASVGFAGASVQRVSALAGVSRRIFYEQFRSKEDVYLQLYGRLSNALVERVTAAGEEGGTDWARRCLQALLTFVAAEPTLARVSVVDVLSAGPAALAERDRCLRTFAVQLERLSGAGGAPPLTPLAAEGLVGAVHDVIYHRVAEGQTAQLPGLLDGLHRFCLSVLGAPRPSDGGAEPRAAGSGVSR